MKFRAFNTVFIILFLCSCTHDPAISKWKINTDHLDFLYEEITVNNKELGIVHIYSNYPEYNWIGDDDEGIACVDDAARAGIFYLKHYHLTNDKKSLNKVFKIADFILYMHSDNGWFYNFIWQDGSINRKFKTSENKPSWWTWRAIWFLTECLPVIKNKDAEISSEIETVVNETVNSILKHFSDMEGTVDYKGISVPKIFHETFGIDQAAILLLGLTNYYKSSNNEKVLKLIKSLSDGIKQMQIGDQNHFPHYAFMSWKNIWHGYGNIQSYALLRVYEITKDKSYLNSALNEIDHFYSWLIKENYMNSFEISIQEGEITSSKVKKYSQIAYDIRPMIWASLKAYEITEMDKYANKAAKIASWFFGNNIAKAKMYSSDNGRCFDGINSKNSINKNSGAESTIEALLSLIEIERYEKTKNRLNELIK